MTHTSVDVRSLLTIWGKGSTESEYLSSDILRIEGYLTDPSSPQGGPDGKKDLVCVRENVKFVAACWFPNNSNTKSFDDAKSKFEHDLSGVKSNQASGFIFITNMHLTLSDRKALTQIAQANGCGITEIFHLERIRAILDSPQGYGTRLRVFSIAMTTEEQISYYESVRKDAQDYMRDKLNSIDLNIQSLHKKVDLMVGAMGATMSAAAASGVSYILTAEVGDENE